MGVEGVEIDELTGRWKRMWRQETMRLEEMGTHRRTSVGLRTWYLQVV